MVAQAGVALEGPEAAGAAWAAGGAVEAAEAVVEAAVTGSVEAGSVAVEEAEGVAMAEAVSGEEEGVAAPVMVVRGWVEAGGEAGDSEGAGVTEAVGSEEATGSVAAGQEEVVATEAEGPAGAADSAAEDSAEAAATEAADWEEATGVEAMEAEAAHSNKTCRPAPPRHGPQLHRRRSTLPKDTRGGSSRYDHLPHRPQRSATRHYVRPLHLRSHPWPESDQRQQLVKNERPPSHRRHRHLRCTRSQRN